MSNTFQHTIWSDIVYGQILCLNEEELINHFRNAEVNQMRKTHRFVTRSVSLTLSGLSTESGRLLAIQLISDQLKDLIDHRQLIESNYLLCERLSCYKHHYKAIQDIDSIQDMNILHAWNWKMNDIKSRLQAIKNAGYGAIQISPMQPKVDKTSYSNESTKSQWWKLYQPLAFKIAEGSESFLGTKSDLTSLCTEAKKYNIKIVVDIVSNHLAGSNNNYSDQVYTRYPLHTYSGGGTNDNSVEAVVRGHIGLPDLDTSNKELQNDVLNMLKDYVDCGVSGFRFDAAKHIETPDDGEFASDYWPTILNGTTTYALNKNLDQPYYYGEVLNTCGTGRSFSSYTKMMSICDNNQGSDLVKAVNNKSLSSIKKTYNTGANPDHLVLWAESHDTYSNDSGYEKTRDYSTETINKAYIIQASRKDAATLYFARPNNINVTICSTIAA